MVVKKITFDLMVYETIQELDQQEQLLLKAAEKARKKAYAPYSNFNVGAAVLLANGEIVLGNNQENASYPSGLCAERVALFFAAANYPEIDIIAIAVSATSVNYVVNKPAAPCGNCRQVISEYEIKQRKPIAIIMAGETGEILKCNTLSAILPLAFNSTFLEEEGGS